ncbi:MAG: hypothetical protein V3R85_08420 [Alphaproteobacteria bacterium]
MKKTITFFAIVFIVIAGLTSCGKSGVPKAGNAQAENMLKLLPANADGIVFIDLARAMEMEFARKAITEDEDIQAFIEMTNIDPLKDIFFLAGAVTQKENEGDKEKVAAILNLNYDKDKILALIREKAQEEGQEISETDYEGFTIYGMWEDDKEISLTFIDESNILAGDKTQTQAIIDVILKKTDNFYSNETLANLVSKTDKQAILWGAIHFAPESLDEMTADNPMLQDLKNLQAVSISMGVPTVWDYIKKPADRALVEQFLAQMVFGRPYIMNPGAPARHVNTIRAAFDATMKDKAFLAEAKKVRLAISPATGVEVQKLVTKMYTMPKSQLAALKKVMNM